ncbi:helix-turn-helix domain-containing protein [Microcoleus sp. F10-C6]|uniref:helix-turn-helix domain-containing protein n=1 Tax=unclassified Microcoleus TaxID=2642155 RepID=UPI002FD32A70
MPAKNHLSQNQKQRLIKILKESDDNYVREKVLILLLINDGKTYQEISEFMEIAYTTVAYWSGEHPTLAISINTQTIVRLS